MPDPWPALKPPAPSVSEKKPPLSRRWPLLNSRFALAATVALCLVGSMSLGSFFSVGATFPPETRDHQAGSSGSFEPCKTSRGTPVKVRVTEHGKNVKIEVIKVDPMEMPEDGE
jgi:hypothetical protein